MSGPSDPSESQADVRTVCVLMPDLGPFPATSARPSAAGWSCWPTTPAACSRPPASSVAGSTWLRSRRPTSSTPIAPWSRPRSRTRSRPRSCSTTATAATSSPTHSSRTRSTTASPRTRRARLHRAAAEAIEQLEPANPPLAAIAYHYCRALPSGDPRPGPSTTRAEPGDDGGRRGARPSRRCSTSNRPAKRPPAATVGTLDVAAADDACCATWATRTTAPGSTERAQETYAEAVDLADARRRHVGLARVRARSDGRGRRVRRLQPHGHRRRPSSRCSTTPATRLPERRGRVSARSSPRGSRAPATTRAKSNARRSCSADALDARRDRPGDAHGDRGGAGGPPHRALVSRGARGPSAARRRAAHARSVVLGAGGSVARR